MTKHLLLCAAALSVASSAFGAVSAPAVMPNYAFNHISPNGRWMVSEIDGAVAIIDRETKAEYQFAPDDSGMTYYSAGLGNSVSNTGVITLSTTSEGDATYWENGEFKSLDVNGANGVANCANGITPDGSRICGLLAANAMTISEDVIMGVPVYWDRNADGTYSEVKHLPYPTTDFSGRVPQYITAVSISDDGRTIAGQMRDYSGFFHQPIIYTQAPNGEWSYTLLLNDAFHPEGVEVPPYPGEAPAEPAATDFMSPEKKAFYDEDMQSYFQGMGDAPDPADYMTTDEAAEYQAALAAWEVEAMAWQEQWDAFMMAFEEICMVAPQFEFNSVYLTPDGSRYVSTVQQEDPNSFGWFPSYISHPAVIDVAANELTAVYDGYNMTVTQVPNNDVILAFTGVQTTPCTGYVIQNGEVTPLDQYIAAASPELKTWVDETLTRTVEVLEVEIITDPETGEENYIENIVPRDMVYTGLPIASADMKTIAFWSTSDWDYDYLTQAFIVDLPAGENNPDGLDAATTGALITLSPNGVITLDSTVASADFFTPTGTHAFTATTSGTSLAAPRGIYLVKLHLTSGTTATAKLTY